MSLFPSCEFKVFLPKGALRAGVRNEGTLELTLPARIERAERIDLTLQCLAVAGYGSGKSRSVVTRSIFTQPLQIKLEGGLDAGRHTFPFELDVPAHVPPAYSGRDCSVRHRIDLRLDVDWAWDPTASIEPEVVPAPRPPLYRAPLLQRSPVDFHDRVALEIRLDSTVIRAREPIAGEIALRTGHDADFDRVILSLAHAARVRMARGDARHSVAQEIRISAEQLRPGKSVRFRFPGGALPITSANGFLDLSSQLDVALDLSWYTGNRVFSIALDVVPDETELHDAPVAGAALLGDQRLAALAREVARATGLTAGAPPTIVIGREGMVELDVADSSRGADFAATEMFTFPSLELDLRSRPLGILPQGASLAPPPLDRRFTVKAGSARVPAEILSAFFASFMEDAEAIESIQITDQRVAIRRLQSVDDASKWLDVARRAQRRARKIADAIAALPFADESARAAWTAAAALESAHLLPHLPALHEVRRGARTVGGEQRGLVCDIVTKGDETRVSIDLDAPLPASAIPELLAEEPRDELVRVIRTIFERVDAAAPQQIIAVANRRFADPRALFPAIEALLAYSLAARGERRADAPYR